MLPVLILLGLGLILVLLGLHRKKQYNFKIEFSSGTLWFSNRVLIAEDILILRADCLEVYIRFLKY